MGSFLERLPKLPTPTQMGQWDKAAIAFGLPDSLLMENAGSAIFEFLCSRFPDISKAGAAIFIGKGNNGGDGVCIARKLVDCGANVVVFHMAPLEDSRGSCAWEIGLAQADGVIFEHIPHDIQQKNLHCHFLERLAAHGCKHPDIIIDSLLGTGFSNSLNPAYQCVIESINRLKQICGSHVLAVDIPSGLNGLTGTAAPIAVRADATVTLASAKCGLMRPTAKEWTGKVYVKGIGFPAAIRDCCASDQLLLDCRSLLHQEDFIADSYKNVYGHILIIGGARGLSGAAHMAAASALRAGAGLVTVCAPGECLAEIKNGWPEIMTYPLGSGDDWPQELPQEFVDLLSRASALVLGPGMGRQSDSQSFLRELLGRGGRPPTVFDADALAILGQCPDLRPMLTKNDILTPHPGEAAMLLGCKAARIQADRNAALARLKEYSPAAVVLKGAYSLLAQLDMPELICPYDIPQLAIGGAGDVLAGICGAYLGRNRQKENALACAARAVIVHIAAGMIMAEKYPLRGATASELADSVARVHTWLEEIPRGNLREGIAPWPQFC